MLPARSTSCRNASGPAVAGSVNGAVPRDSPINASDGVLLAWEDRGVSALQPPDLSGKVAVVTGAGQGIGLAIASVFAARGVAMVLTRRTRSKLELVRGELRAAGAHVEIAVGDVGVRADLRAGQPRGTGLVATVRTVDRTPMDFALERATTIGRSAQTSVSTTRAGRTPDVVRPTPDSPARVGPYVRDRIAANHQ